MQSWKSCLLFGLIVFAGLVLGWLGAYCYRLVSNRLQGGGHNAIRPAPPSFTMFRGNALRNLSGTGTVPRRPKILWRFQTHTRHEGPFEQRGTSASLNADTPWPGLGWTGQPCYLDGRYYFGSSDSYVYCLDADSGNVAWYYPNHHCIKGSISIFGGRIYHGGRDNKIHCYSLDGQMVWETRTGNDMDSNPVIVDGTGYIGGEDCSIYAFDPLTGDIRWRFAPTDGSVESSPCVTDKYVIAGSGHGFLYAVERATGKLAWKARTLGDTDSTPVYWQGRLYVGCATGDYGERGHLWCFDAETGSVIWHRRFPRGFWATAALNPALGRLYIGCNNGTFYAVRMADAVDVWTRQLGGRVWGSAAVVDDCVLVGVRDGRFWCLNERDGAPIWVFDDGGDIDATPCVVNGRILIGSQSTWVYCIGEAGIDEAINPHWFVTDFPLKGRTDHDPDGISTARNPAPAPATYRDTGARYRKGIYRPVYGAGQ